MAHTTNNATTTTAVKNEDVVDDTVVVKEEGYESAAVPHNGQNMPFQVQYFLL